MNALAAAIVMVYSVLWYLSFSVIGDNQQRAGLLRLTLLIEEKIRKTGARFQHWWSAAFASFADKISNPPLKHLAEFNPESATAPLAIDAMAGHGPTASSHTQPDEYSGL